LHQLITVVVAAQVVALLAVYPFGGWAAAILFQQALNDAVPNYGQAGAYAMSLLVLTTMSTTPGAHSPTGCAGRSRASGSGRRLPRTSGGNARTPAER